MEFRIVYRLPYGSNSETTIAQGDASHVVARKLAMFAASTMYATGKADPKYREATTILYIDGRQVVARAGAIKTLSGDTMSPNEEYWIEVPKTRGGTPVSLAQLEKDNGADGATFEEWRNLYAPIQHMQSHGIAWTPPVALEDATDAQRERRALQLIEDERARASATLAKRGHTFTFGLRLSDCTTSAEITSLLKESEALITPVAPVAPVAPVVEVAP